MDADPAMSLMVPAAFSMWWSLFTSTRPYVKPTSIQFMKLKLYPLLSMGTPNNALLPRSS